MAETGTASQRPKNGLRAEQPKNTIAATAASNIDLMRNGEPVDTAGLAGSRIANNCTLLFADTKPVTLNVRESRDGTVRQIARAGAGPANTRRHQTSWASGEIPSLPTMLHSNAGRCSHQTACLCECSRPGQKPQRSHRARRGWHTGQSSTTPTLTDHRGVRR